MECFAVVVIEIYKASHDEPKKSYLYLVYFLHFTCLLICFVVANKTFTPRNTYVLNFITDSAWTVLKLNSKRLTLQKNLPTFNFLSVLKFIVKKSFLLELLYCEIIFLYQNFYEPACKSNQINKYQNRFHY